MDAEALQFHHGNVDRLARRVAQRRMKAENIQPDERLALACRNRHALHLRRRPDAQPLAFGPQPFHQRDVKAVQFDARVEAILQRFNNACAQERLCTAQAEVHNDGSHRQGSQQPARNPLDPPVSAPKRFPNLCHARPRLAPIVAGFADSHLLWLVFHSVTRNSSQPLAAIVSAS